LNWNLEQFQFEIFNTNMNTCIHVCTQLRLHTQHIHVHIYIYLCVCTCIYVCLITCIYTRTHTHTQKHIQLYIHLSIYMFTCTCVCVYRCIYKFIYISLCQFYQKKLPVWTVPQNSSFVATRIPTVGGVRAPLPPPWCPDPPLLKGLRSPSCGRSPGNGGTRFGFDLKPTLQNFISPVK